MAKLNKEIVKLVEEDVSDMGSLHFKIDFMGDEFTFDKLYDSVQNIREVTVVEHNNFIDQSFMDFMIEDLGEDKFYEYLSMSNSYREYLKEVEIDESREKGYKSWLTNKFFDNSYYYMSRYFNGFTAIHSEEGYRRLYFEMNMFLKRLGLRFGAVGEENWSYYVTLEHISGELVQDVFYNENFYTVIWISRQNNKELQRFSEFHVSTDTTIEDLTCAVEDFFGFNDFLMVDNRGAEHFDDVKKVKEFKVENYAYIEI